MNRDVWRITGGQSLEGRVSPSGSKNGCLPTLAATLLIDGETTLQNVPDISDVRTMIEILRALGLAVDDLGESRVRITNLGLHLNEELDDLVRRMRASHYVLGPMALKLGHADIPMPGGCELGMRPVDHFLAVLDALGARSRLDEDRINVDADRFIGDLVRLDGTYLNPGATFTAVMIGALAEGETIVENASSEPDVVSFCDFLTAAGASIEWLEDSTLKVMGVSRLEGTTHRVNSDRLEAGTFLCAAAATGGDVVVDGFTVAELGSIAEQATKAGVELHDEGGEVRVHGRKRPRPIHLVTRPYPGFPTDLQPPLAAVLAQADGESTIEESIYDGRLQYIEDLNKMGAQMRRLDSRRAVIAGVEMLHGAEVEGKNIRDGAALIVAALSAEGESTVSGCTRYVSRGYENLDEKLRSLGAQIASTG